MKRNMLEFILMSNKYFHGGIKEACVIAKEYITHKDNSCVSEEEFFEAVKTLIAYSFQNADDECNVDKEALRKCPYFEDEGLI